MHHFDLLFQVPEQKEYMNDEEEVRCSQETINHCEKVPKKVCHTEVQKANITIAEIEQKCEQEPKQVCRTEMKAVAVPYFEAEQHCVKVPFEVRVS